MGDDELTIDELAQRVDLPSSTIRLYQTRGLLPAPRKQGRVAYYGSGHVARIDLISRLQERGFSLASIGELVRGWEGGRSLDEVLGLEQRVPGAGPTPALRMTPVELARRFPSIEITPDVIERVVKMGLVELADDGSLLVHSPAFLEVGSALVDLGFPLGEVLDEASTLQGVMHDVAARFARLFERHVWRPFADAGMPAEDLPRVTDVLDRLGPLADRVVHATLVRALAAEADRFLAAEAQRPGSPTRSRGSASRRPKR